MLVSAIVTTKNETRNIENLLKSLKTQTHKQLEIIVVDNASTDTTVAISKNYTSKVFNFGPERSAQRNFGVKKATGKYVLILDADMVLQPEVVAECVKAVNKNPHLGGLIIPEKSFGIGFWSQVKAEERSWYVGDENIEAERFFSKAIFEQAGGYDLKVTGPEDWDLPIRTRKLAPHSRISAFILHNEGRQSFWRMVRKKYYYAHKLSTYLTKNQQSPLSPQQVYFLRSSVYKNIFKIWRSPAIYLGIWLLLIAQTISGMSGYFVGKLSSST